MKQSKRRKVVHDETAASHTSPAHQKPLQPRQPQPSAHAMRTRSKTRVFRFLDLPAELKNRVYGLAFAGAPVDLWQLRLPRSLAVPQILSEARAFFFENTPVTVVIRTNWCVRNEHLHFSFLDDTEPGGHGHVEWPAAVTSQSSELVRLRDVMIEGLCCCCLEGDVLVRMRVEFKPKSEEEATGKLDVKIPFTEMVNGLSTSSLRDESLGEMLATANECTKEIASRQDFNGLTVQDVEEPISLEALACDLIW